MPTLQRVAELSVLIPLAHVLACSIFLLGYIGGFHSGLSALLSVSDLFGVSLGHVALMYVSMLLIPAFLTFRTNRKIAAKDYSKKSVEELSALAVKSAKRLNRLEWIFIGIGALAVIWVSLHIFTGRQASYSILAQGILIANLPAADRYLEKLGLSSRAKDIAFPTFFFVLVALANGVDAGASDRRAPYATLAGRTFFCNRHIVVRAAGNRFIAVAPSGRRVVISEDCKVKFLFPTVKAFNVEPFF